MQTASASGSGASASAAARRTLSDLSFSWRRASSRNGARASSGSRASVHSAYRRALAIWFVRPLRTNATRSASGASWWRRSWYAISGFSGASIGRSASNAAAGSSRAGARTSGWPDRAMRSRSVFGNGPTLSSNSAASIAAPGLRASESSSGPRRFSTAAA
jgi:hypothetical protein